MRIWKTRPAAWVVSAIVMILALLLGVHISCTRQAEKVEALFYQGTNSAGSSNTVAIDDLLNQRVNAAMGLETVTDAYDVLTTRVQALRQARTALSGAGTIGEKYRANTALTDAAEELSDAMAQAGLSERNIEGAELYFQRLRGAQSAIEQNTYNEKVDEFEREILSGFPVNVLKGPALVSGPERFGGPQ